MDITQLLRENSSSTGLDNRGWNFYTYLSPSNTEWVVPPSNVAKLIHGYCTYVASHEDIWDGTGTPPSLAERQVDTPPVIFSFTFPFADNEAKTDSDRANHDASLYDDRFLTGLVNACQGVLYNQLNITDVRSYFVGILESPHPWRQRGTDGSQRVLTRIELTFPYCRVSPNDQRRYLYPELVRLLHSVNLCATLPKQPLGDWNSILNVDILNGPLLMYGSTAEREILPLKLRDIVDVVQNPKTDALRPLALKDVFIPTQHRDVQRGIISPEIFESEDLETWLPLFFSGGYHQVVTLPKARPSEDKKVSAAPNHYDVKLEEDEGLGNQADLAQTLLGMISLKRVADTNEWMDIGRALHTTFRGSDVGRRLWKDFTTKSGERESKDCEALYDDLGGRNYVTVKTLGWYARMDSHDAYVSWHKQWCSGAYHRMAGLTSNEVAIACFRYFWLEYLYGPSRAKGRRGDRGWWHFRTGKWVDGEMAFEDLERDMLGTFRRSLEAYRTTISSEIQNSADERMRAVGEAEMKNINTLISKLGEETYIKKICSLMRLRFSTRLPLLEIMDSNVRTMGHENGVWEIVEDVAHQPGEKWCKFRQSKPEDYITMSTKLWFNQNLTWNSPSVQEVLRYTGQVFTDIEIARFARIYDASIILGGNRDKIFTMRTGVQGNNSKSLDQKLKRKTFGDYAKQVSTSVLSGKQGKSGEANPEEARLVNARLVITCESEHDEKMKTGKAKELTGGDDRFIRTLYDEGREIQQTYKITVFSNHDMRVTEADKAIKNRILIIPYDSVWDENAPDDVEAQYKERHFKANPEFENKLPKLASAYAWVLYQYFEEYKKTPYLVVPAAIRQRTDEYWKDNDIYTVFISQRMIATEPSVILHYEDVWQEFTRWYNRSKFDSPQPDMQMVIKNLQLRLGNLQAHHWHGWRINRSGAGSNVMQQGQAMPALMQGFSAQQPPNPQPLPNPQMSQVGNVPTFTQPSADKLEYTHPLMKAVMLQPTGAFTNAFAATPGMGLV